MPITFKLQVYFTDSLYNKLDSLFKDGYIKKKSDKYMEGVSCSYCYEKLSSEQKQRFTERQKQIELAQSRGEQHIGGEVKNTILKKKILKNILFI